MHIIIKKIIIYNYNLYNYFIIIYNYLENSDDCQFSLNELLDICEKPAPHIATAVSYTHLYIRETKFDPKTLHAWNPEQTHHPLH